MKSKMNEIETARFITENDNVFFDLSCMDGKEAKWTEQRPAFKIISPLEELVEFLEWNDDFNVTPYDHKQIKKDHSCTQLSPSLPPPTEEWFLVSGTMILSHL
jgi:hypothetical protein